jgi:hypothetical protein
MARNGGGNAKSVARSADTCFAPIGEAMAAH